MSKFRIFLTGQPGVGKSTIVRRLSERLVSQGYSTGGMVSGELREGGTRVGFEILDVRTGRKGTLAHVRIAMGPKVGRYTVNLTDLEAVGAQAIIDAVNTCNVVVIDEVGPMELKSTPFKQAIEFALDSGKPLIGTIHRNVSDPLVKRIKEDPLTRLFEVTYANRASLAEQLECEVSGLKVV